MIYSAKPSRPTFLFLNIRFAKGGRGAECVFPSFLLLPFFFEPTKFFRHHTTMQTSACAAAAAAEEVREDGARNEGGKKFSFSLPRQKKKNGGNGGTFSISIFCPLYSTRRILLAVVVVSIFSGV